MSTYIDDLSKAGSSVASQMIDEISGMMASSEEAIEASEEQQAADAAAAKAQSRDSSLDSPIDLFSKKEKAKIEQPKVQETPPVKVEDLDEEEEPEVEVLPPQQEEKAKTERPAQPVIEKDEAMIVPPVETPVERRRTEEKQSQPTPSDRVIDKKLAKPVEANKKPDGSMAYKYNAVPSKDIREPAEVVIASAKGAPKETPRR